MNLRELLDHDLLKLPKSWRNEGDFSYYEGVSRLAKDYYELVDQLDENDITGDIPFIGTITKVDLLNGIKKVTQAVRESIKIYLDQGNPHKSLNSFSSEFIVESETRNSIRPSFYMEMDSVYPRHYRLRSGIECGDVHDLFHVPFESRHKLNSNRYSIPGFPTLYLSNSVFTAYRELNSPDYDDLYVSKIEFVGAFNKREYLLDMTNKPQFDSLDYNFRYLARWPLIMACSLKVGYPEYPFKPEYILPQIIFQWAKNNYKIGGKPIIGVKYPSTKVEGFKEGNTGAFYNTAIPVHHSSKSGYCEVLTEMFKVSKPISFINALESSVQPSVQGQVKSILLNGAITEYVATDFGKIETVLNESAELKTFHVKANY